MRSFAAIALLYAGLLVATPVPRLPGLPNLPKLPEPPTAPNAPNAPPGSIPGRWPGEGQNPDLLPGRLPDQPEPQRPDASICTGLKRANCDGLAVIQRLDELVTNPPGQPYDGPTIDMLTTRYVAQPTQISLGKDDLPLVLQKEPGAIGTW